MHGYTDTSRNASICPSIRASLVAQWSRICLPMQETWVGSLEKERSGRSTEEGSGTHSSILAWEIPWTEEPGGL